MPKVSVIIPTYNREAMVSEAIQSVLDQTYTDYEIIVVDDGSTDGTGKLLQEKFGEKIHYYYQENQGLPPRNKAIRLAAGEYLAFLDSDDLWRPDKLASQVQILNNAGADTGLVYTGIEMINSRGQVVEELIDNFQGVVVDKLIDRNFIPTSSVMMRRGCFKRCGFFDESLKRSEDWDLWLRVALAYRVVAVPDVLVTKRHFDNHLMADVTRLDSIITVLDKFFSHPDCPAQLQAAKKTYYARRYLSFVAKCYYCNQIDKVYLYFFKAMAISPGALRLLHVRMLLTAPLRLFLRGKKRK